MRVHTIIYVTLKGRFCNVYIYTHTRVIIMNIWEIKTSCLCVRIYIYGPIKPWFYHNYILLVRSLSLLTSRIIFSHKQIVFICKWPLNRWKPMNCKMDCSLMCSFVCFVGMLRKLSLSKKSMTGKRSPLGAEEETDTTPIKTNMVEKRRVLIETGCSSAISPMIWSGRQLKI